jgi:hypothetical protein
MERQLDIHVTGDVASSGIERRVSDQPGVGLVLTTPAELGLSAELASRFRAWQRWFDDAAFLCGLDNIRETLGNRFDEVGRQLAERAASELGPAARVTYGPQAGWCRRLCRGAQIVVQGDPAELDVPPANGRGGYDRSFRTLRGAIEGEEPDEPTYFAYSATLRIHGQDLPFDEIAGRLQVRPTEAHRRGERRGPTSPGYRDDAWHYRSPLAEAEPLARHIDALWAIVRPQVDYLQELKRRHRVDVFCGYRSNCDHAGIEVPAAARDG